jgi:hypothetical protein
VQLKIGWQLSVHQPNWLNLSSVYQEIDIGKNNNVTVFLELTDTV